jgi:TolB-like protein/Tfp pilus assembly protein PilF
VIGIGLVSVAVMLVLGGLWHFLRNDYFGAERLSIAVLPFTNLSADADQTYLADGFTNDLTADLARVPGLFVIAHATARTFQGRNVDIEDIGRKLNIRYVLNGSIDRSDETIRIIAELVSVETGAALWAARFETERDRLSSSRNEILGQIANALNFRLTRLESQRGLRERLDDPEAADLTTRGWALVYAGKLPANYERARQYFSQALAQDPKAVNAHTGVGWTSAIMVLDGWSDFPQRDIAAAQASINSALAIDRNHVVAHHVSGFLSRLQKRSYAARDSFQTAIELNPNFAPGHAQLGITELELGRPEAVFAAVEKAIGLSPRDPSLGPWLAFVGMAHLHLGNDVDAISWLERAINQGTPVALHKAYLASALALAGRLDEARTALAIFKQMNPKATITGLRNAARSDSMAFLNQQERLFKGLRIAGLPE